jgi:tetratricopeptide (TPR) repeat protein
VQTETANGESRFRLLEVIREYALEILEASGESETIRKNHARYFLTLAKSAESEFFGRNAASWLDRLEEEHDNLRAALSRASVVDAETLMNLAAALRSFWLLHNHLTEGRKWLETALEISSEASAELRSKLLHGLGQAALYQGDNRTARKMFAESLNVGRAAGDKRQIALSNRGLAAAAKQQGDIAGARKFIEEALAINRESNDIFGIAVSLNNLGDLARMEDDYVSARRLLEEALAICRRLGNKEGICGCLNNLGAVTYGEGDYEAAQEHYAEALKTSRELGDKVTISYSLNGFAALAARRGDVERAIKLTGAAQHLRESLGFEIEPAERRFCERYLIRLKTGTDEAAFADLLNQGRKLKLEEAAALCFSVSGANNT